MDFRTTGGKLNFKDGDIDTASPEEHDREMVERIVYEPKGSFLLNPTLGVGVEAMLNGPWRDEEVRKSVRVNLKADDFQIFNIVVDKQDGDNRLLINARR